MRRVVGFLMVLGFLALGASGMQAQTMSFGTRLTPSPFLTTDPPKTDPSPHLTARLASRLDEENRQTFEDNAGENAGKLLLRSVPTGSDVFINDLFVGRTPLLIVIAPGKYDVDVRGPRLETGHKSVGVIPKETETVVIALDQRYPATISMR
jgi:PEGA domain